MTQAEAIEEWIKRVGVPDAAADAVRRKWKRIKATPETIQQSWERIEQKKERKA